MNHKELTEKYAGIWHVGQETPNSALRREIGALFERMSSESTHTQSPRERRSEYAKKLIDDALAILESDTPDFRALIVAMALYDVGDQIAKAPETN